MKVIVMFLHYSMFCLAIFSTLYLGLCRSAPFVLRVSCGAREDVHTQLTNNFYHKDFAYTGGIPGYARYPSPIIPELVTVRYFPLYEGDENCYNINRVPKGYFQMRVFIGLMKGPNFDKEPIFDISFEGTLVYSLKSGWSSLKDGKTFVEALMFLKTGSASFCFHSTGHGDPTVRSIEIIQVDDKGYSSDQNLGSHAILRTVERLSFGHRASEPDKDHIMHSLGGDRLWSYVTANVTNSFHSMSTQGSIKQGSFSRNFYSDNLYKTAIVSTDSQPDLTVFLDVDPNANYSIWLHFAEIDASVTGPGQRIFSILINGENVFKEVDIVKMSGDVYTALILNKIVLVSGRTLKITLQPSKGSYATISALEVFAVIESEAKTSPTEVRALKRLKTSLGLPHRLGWNGDPCVPQQHPWNGIECRFESKSGSWVVNGISLSMQGLKGFLPNQISQLRHLQRLNLSGNSIHGVIPSSLGNMSTLEILDLSYNSFNGSIPENFGKLRSIRKLNLNRNLLSGRVPDVIGGRLLHGASFNLTDNAGLCGIPGLPTCESHVSSGAKIGIGFASCGGFLLVVIFAVCWCKRRRNVLRIQRLSGGVMGAPYAKARTLSFCHEMQQQQQMLPQYHRYSGFNLLT